MIKTDHLLLLSASFWFMTGLYLSPLDCLVSLKASWEGLSQSSAGQEPDFPVTGKFHDFEGFPIPKQYKTTHFKTSHEMTLWKKTYVSSWWKHFVQIWCFKLFFNIKIFKMKSLWNKRMKRSESVPRPTCCWNWYISVKRLAFHVLAFADLKMWAGKLPNSSMSKTF